MWRKLLAFFGVAISLFAVAAIRIPAFVLGAALLDLFTAVAVYFLRPNQSPS
jgi:xanthine/uracil permease